jgi:hypothetical protein
MIGSRSNAIRARNFRFVENVVEIYGKDISEGAKK